MTTPPAYHPHIPQTIGEIVDKLGWMMLKSPTLEDDYFPYKNVESVFYSLNEGLNVVRRKLGEERYAALIALSDRMRAHFEADPEDKTGEATKGRKLILEMQTLLKQPGMKVVR